MGLSTYSETTKTTTKTTSNAKTVEFKKRNAFLEFFQRIFKRNAK